MWSSLIAGVLIPRRLEANLSGPPRLTHYPSRHDSPDTKSSDPSDMFSATPALVLATMWFATTALALGKPHAWTRGLERRTEFEFLSPKYGQSITASDSGWLNVTWTNTSRSDVALSLSLLQGGPGELAQVKLINGAWRLVSCAVGL